jgi:hypothetical protein
VLGVLTFVALLHGIVCLLRQAGDVILEVDNKSVKQWQLDILVERMVAKETSLRLTYIRGGYNMHFAELMPPPAEGYQPLQESATQVHVTYQTSGMGSAPSLAAARPEDAGDTEQRGVTYETDIVPTEEGGFMSTWNAFVAEQFVINSMLKANTIKRDLPVQPKAAPVFDSSNSSSRTETCAVPGGSDPDMVDGISGWEYPVLPATEAASSRDLHRPLTPPSYVFLSLAFVSWSESLAVDCLKSSRLPSSQAISYSSR